MRMLPLCCYRSGISGGDSRRIFYQEDNVAKSVLHAVKLYLNIRTHLLFPAIYRGKILLAANLIGKKPDAFQVSDYTLC